ncbi:MAG TPA: NifU family protein [Acidimicrobiales bacterium]|nr:NifU family protein [Acidimicrobiales bacterium]
MSNAYERVDIETLAYEDVMPRVGELFDELMTHPDAAVRDRVEEMMDLFDAFHREGLGRLVEMIRAWRGEIFLESVSRDDVTGYFLNAYDLGEAPDEREQAAAYEAVDTALEELRPMIESHGGMITVEDVRDGVVKVQMLGSCDGCPSSSATLTGGLEEALRRHWPNFRRLEVVEPGAEEEPAAALPEPEPVLLQIGRKPAGS